MIDRIVSSLVSTDGRHMVLTGETTDGAGITLGVACDQIASLIDHCALAGAKSERILRSGEDLKVAASWWNSAMDRDSGAFTLMLTFGKGGTLAFGLSEHMARKLLATLSVHFEADLAAMLPDASTRIPVTEPASPGFT
jgi:hypothetical protein